MKRDSRIVYSTTDGDLGGSVRNGVIEVQCDHRNVVLEMLKGYAPVVGGG